MANAKHDENRAKGLLAENDSGVIVPLLATDVTSRLKVDAVISSGGSAGTQYTEGDTDATITGTVAMGEAPGDVLEALQLDASGNLNVNVAAGSSAGTEYTDGDADATPTGTVMMGTDGSNVFATATDTDGHLQVDVLTGGGGGTQYTEGDTDATIVGTAIMFESNTGTSAVSAVSNTTPLPISDAGGALTVDGTVTAELSAVDNAVLDTIAAKDFATQTTLAAINAKLVTGTDIGDVTINNSTGAAAVNIQDGGNTITVDGTVTANLSATDNAVLDQIELNQDSQTAILTAMDADTGGILTAVQLIDNAISGNEMQVDVVGSLPAGSAIIGNVGHAITGMGHGVKTITSAGTDEALAGSTACKRVVIQSQTDNTGLIAVGATGVDATVATGTGILLYPGDSFELEIDNLADVFIDASVNGEGVRYTYFT